MLPRVRHVTQADEGVDQIAFILSREILPVRSKKLFLRKKS